MSSDNKRSEVLTVGSGSGMLVFSMKWEADRFQHEISRADGSSLVSINSDDQLATPVYTECHFQDDKCFLSGASHHRHWSLSVECLDDQRFMLDAACRTKSPGRVGTIYSAFKRGIEVASFAGSDASTDVDRTETGYCVRPATRLESLPATLRWKYTLAACD